MADKDLEKIYSDEQEEADPFYDASIDQTPIGQNNTQLQDRQQILGQKEALPPVEFDEQDLPKTTEQTVYGTQPQSKLDLYQQMIDELNKNEGKNAQYQKNLTEAQNVKNQQNLNTALAMAGAQIGQAFATGAGSKQQVDYTPYQQLNKMSDEQLAGIQKQIQLGQTSDENRFRLLKDITNEQRNRDLAAQRAAQEARLEKAQNLDQKIKEQELDIKNQQNDPDSDLSKRMGQILEDTIPDLKGTTAGLSYNDMLAKQKFVEQKYGLDLKKLSIKAQMDNAKANQELKKTLAEARINAQQEKADAKRQTENTNRVDKLNKMIDSEIASSRSSFGKAALTKQNIQAAEALLNSEKNLDDLDNRQVVEAAKTLDRILSGGNPTISGSEHLTPQTARMKAAKLLEFYTNQRQGAGAGSFLKNIQHTLQREKDVADQQIKSTQGKILAGYSDLKDDPRVQKILAVHDLPSDIWDYKPKQQDPQISNYAKQYNLGYDQAEKILKARGYSSQ